MHAHPRIALGALLPVLLGGIAPRALAQSVESEVPPSYAGAVPDAAHYAVPDIPDRDLTDLNVSDEQKPYSIKWGIVALPADYTSFSQDANSKEQVGTQKDTYEVRSLRLMMRGYFELFRHWDYVLSYEYKGFDSDPGTADWAATDVKIATTFEHLGTLAIGKMKEPFVYEMVGDAANLPQSERLLNPFFKSRNDGLQLSNSFGPDERATWSVGAYSNWRSSSNSFRDAGEDFAARVTVLPVWAEDGARYLHLGASLRYVGGDGDVLRFKGFPASNVTSPYVDTGNMASNHAWNTGLELLWNDGPYSVLAEYVTSSVSSSSAGDPHFYGYYVTGSWVLTGEHRPYDKKAAYARRILPTGRWGAWELVGRYGRVSLDDAAVHGGTMYGGWAALNWWATRRWKFSVQYGDVDLNRFGIIGHTRELLSRAQWIF
jgi:phosphate-selective porin